MDHFLVPPILKIGKGQKWNAYDNWQTGVKWQIHVHMLILFSFLNVFFLKLLSGCFSLLKMYLCLKNVLGCFRCPQFSKLDGNCHLERDILNPCCMKRVCDPTKITVAPSPGFTPKPVPRESHLETQFSL